MELQKQEHLMVVPMEEQDKEELLENLVPQELLYIVAVEAVVLQMELVELEELEEEDKVDMAILLAVLLQALPI